MTRTHVLLSAAAALAFAAAFSSKTSPAPVAFRPPLPPPLATGAGPLKVSATLSSDVLLVGDSDVDVRVDLVAGAGAGAKKERRPLELAVAIDHSGSMQGEKMEAARRAATQLIDQLHEGDRLALIAFSTDVSVFPLTDIDPASRERMRTFVANLWPDGSTNISGALEAANAQLPGGDEAAIRRIVLISDGQPTVGIMDHAALRSLVDGYRGGGVSTSAFGVGLDFNGPLMQDLANHGGGNSAFIERGEKLSLALQNEVNDAASTVARNVSLKLALPAHVTLKSVPGRDFKQTGGQIEVPLYDFAPGQTAQVLLRLAVKDASQGPVMLGSVSASFTDVAREAAALSTPLPLTAQASSDPAQVQAGMHADVVELARKADLNVQLREAERAYDSGDTSHAVGLLDNIRRLFGTSADSLAGEDLGDVDRKWRAGGEDGARATKSLTMKTMRNFGQNNAAQY